MLKKVIRNLLPPFLFQALRKLYNTHYSSKNDLYTKMSKYFDYDNGYYIELGAYDGIAQSNTYRLERQQNWRGLLIEPSPNKYFECINNRSAANHIVCAACVSFEYKCEFVKIKYSGFFTAPVSVETDLTDIEAHTATGAQYLSRGEKVFEFGAKAITLTELLKQANAPSVIDFLSLDVEGGEIEVLKGIDYIAYRFKYMLIECRNFGKVNDYLQLQGYRFKEQLSRHDYLFVPVEF